MNNNLFGAGTVTQTLRGGLTELSDTHRTIATRIATAQAQSANGDFAGQLSAQMALQEEELNQNMASLADTELRYDAASRLLHQSYSDFHTAIRNSG